MKPEIKGENAEELVKDHNGELPTEKLKNLICISNMKRLRNLLQKRRKIGQHKQFNRYQRCRSMLMVGPQCSRCEHERLYDDTIQHLRKNFKTQIKIKINRQKIILKRIKFIFLWEMTYHPRNDRSFNTFLLM